MATCPQGHDPGEAGLADGYCDVCGSRLTGAAGTAAPPPAGSAHAGGGNGAAAASAPSAVSAHPAGDPAASGAAASPAECAACGAPISGRFCEDCGHDQTAPVPDRTAGPGPAGPAGRGSPGASGPTGWAPIGSGPAHASGPAYGTGPPYGTGAGHASGSPYGTGAGHASGSGHGSGPPYGTGPAHAGGPAQPGSGAVPAWEWEVTIQADRAHYDRMIAQGGPDAERVLFPPYCPRRDVPLTGAEARIGRVSRSRNLVPEIDLSGPPEDPGVSHLHAVLLPAPGGGWTLIDPGSANGTVVNGRQIAVNEPVPVGDGDRIHLGAWTLITLRRRRET
ncbi:FHA domain-containing protein [Planobispora siamensis]|uniref:FHA domain-containing protein n=1 Tax=Planobispora siamensis TaxID=936338 RepID=A0A8J3WP00_9ACTN|nr:FHA domain-containing protein [Planobispora siamensis]GIH95072.1 hypothetical protein Psi01_57020 [Planobispora siamensis]